MMARNASSPLFESDLRSLKRIGKGKVRDIYAVDGDKMMIVVSDRLSAFDVVLSDPIPDKGRVLTELANFWFEKLKDVVPNHLTGVDPESVVKGEDEKAQVRGRAIVVKKLKPLPIEAVVRGYIIGSGWKDYQATGKICGIALPKGLQQAQKLPEPIFTPATKAESGHDENISFARMCEIVGKDIGEKVKAVSIRLYKEASDFAATKGIIIADTKFEFGILNGHLILIDEVMTPDSSRFWPKADYKEGVSQKSFDKQFVRDYLETLKDWNKTPPGPALPEEIVLKTREKYVEAYERVTGKKFGDFGKD